MLSCFSRWSFLVVLKVRVLTLYGFVRSSTWFGFGCASVCMCSFGSGNGGAVAAGLVRGGRFRLRPTFDYLFVSRMTASCCQTTPSRCGRCTATTSVPRATCMQV